MTLPLFQRTDPDNPFDDAGDLMVARIVAQGQRAYGNNWPAVRTQMLAAHTDGEADSLNALRHDEALSILQTMATERPDVFAMRRNWKEPKQKKKSKIILPMENAIPNPPVVVSRHDPHDVLIRRDSAFGNPYTCLDALQKYRTLLARRIMGGTVTHAMLTELGRAGKGTARLAFEDGDVSGPVLARAVDSALKDPERVFKLRIWQAFKMEVK